jgi:hypothetical protein
MAGRSIGSAALSAGDNQLASTGNAGKITVTVAGVLSINGQGSGIFTTTHPGTIGNAGSIEVSAGSAALREFGSIASDNGGTGNGGRVSVDVTGRGRGVLTIRTNGEIAAFTFGAGSGGEIVVDVRGWLTIDGAGANHHFVTGIDAGAEPGSTGNGGSVTVRARQITVETGGAIAAATFGAGNGGRIAVDVVGRLTIDGAGANTGFLTGISAGADAGSHGNAGDLLIHARSLTLVDGGAIENAAIGSRDSACDREARGR